MKINGHRKTNQLKEWNIPFKEVYSGIIINDTILISKNKSRWKKLGELNWYSYYGLKNLIEALYDDALDEYAKEQQEKNRPELSPAINHEWKDKEREKVCRQKYEGVTQ